MSVKSKILDNKQLIHIGCEVVVLAGLTFYFSSKNRKLMEHIEDLAQRLEEQEDHIQKLEQTVNNLGSLIQNRVIPSLQQRTNEKSTPPVITQRSIPTPRKAPRKAPRNTTRNTTRSATHRTPRKAQRKAPLREHPTIQAPQHPPPPVEHDEPEIEDEESDLDAEIQEELNELEQPEQLEQVEQLEELHTHSGNLKKHQ